MDTFRVQWWTRGVHPTDAPPCDTAVRVVGVAGETNRAAARRAIRAVLRDALAAWSGLRPERIALHAEPGHAPYALLDRSTEGGGGVQRLALGISHDNGLSVAAWNRDGAIGIDLMRIAHVPDWQAVSRDYLGPAAATALAALPPLARAAAFARAWSAHEARLKCLGLGLTEWNDGLARRLAACRCRALDLPDDYVGHVAMPFG